MGNCFKPKTRTELPAPAQLSSSEVFSIALPTLKQVPLFTSNDNNNDTFLSALAAKLKYKIVPAGEYITKKGDIGDEMFILAYGKFDVLAEIGNTVTVVFTFTTAENANFFGEISLLEEKSRRTADIVSDKTRPGGSSVLVLGKSDFEEVGAQFPVEFEAVKKIAEARLKDLRDRRAAVAELEAIEKRQQDQGQDG